MEKVSALNKMNSIEIGPQSRKEYFTFTFRTFTAHNVGGILLALLAFAAAIMAIASLRQARHIDFPAALTRFVDVIFGCAGLLLRSPGPAVVWTCASLATIGVPIARALDLQQPIRTALPHRLDSQKWIGGDEP